MSVSFSTHNALPNLRNAFPCRESPWKYSKELYESLEQAEQKPGFSFKECLVRPDHPEFDVVMKLFLEQKPGYNIRRVYAVHNGGLTQNFENHLVNQNIEALNPANAPKWHSLTDGTVSQRQAISQRYEHITSQYKPQSLEGRVDSLNGVVVLLLLHGFQSEEIGNNICDTGFLVTGNGGPRTDAGYYGNGIYFSTSAEYSIGYSKGKGRRLLISAVSLRDPYPVVMEDYSSKALMGKANQGRHNAHYIPVTTSFPCKPGEKPRCDEFVVFQSAQTLPRFIIDIQPHTLFQHTNLDQITTAEALADYLIYYLQKPDAKEKMALRDKLRALFSRKSDQGQKKALKTKLCDLFLRRSNELPSQDELFIKLFKVAIQQSGTGVFDASDASKWLLASVVEPANPIIEKEQNTSLPFWEWITQPSVMAVSGISMLVGAGLALYVARNVLIPVHPQIAVQHLPKEPLIIEVRLMSPPPQPVPVQTVPSPPQLVPRIPINAPAITFDPHGEAS